MSLLSSIQPRRRQKLRWLSSLSCLFECVGNLDERWLAVGLSEQRNAYRNSVYIPGRYGDVRIPGDRGSRRIAAAEVIAIDEISWPRRTPGRSDQGVKPVLRHDKIDAL